jgi:hypothetical protein
MNNTLLRDRAFIKKCLKNLQAERARGVEPSVRRIVALTIFGGADSFYISFDRALAMVAVCHKIPVEERVKLLVKQTPSQVRCRHITDLVEKLVAEKHISLTQATLDVLCMNHAPRFYFTIPYGMRLFNKYVKRKFVVDEHKIAV